MPESMKAALPGCHQLHRGLISGRWEPETPENGNDGEIQIPIPICIAILNIRRKRYYE